MKKAGNLLAILITIWMQWYNAGRIAQCSISQASLEATGCRHWASAGAVLPGGHNGRQFWKNFVRNKNDFWLHKLDPASFKIIETRQLKLKSSATYLGDQTLREMKNSWTYQSAMDLEKQAGEYMRY